MVIHRRNGPPPQYVFGNNRDDNGIGHTRPWLATGISVMNRSGVLDLGTISSFAVDVIAKTYLPHHAAPVPLYLICHW